MDILSDNTKTALVHPRWSRANMQFLIRRHSSCNKDTVPDKACDYYLKVILLGNCNSGKTTLARSFVSEKLSSEKQNKMVDMHPSAFADNILIVRDKNVHLRLYDTAGQEKYRSLTASYYRGAHGCLILYDVTKESSFDSITHCYHMYLEAIKRHPENSKTHITVTHGLPKYDMLQDLKDYASQPEISLIIVGTKCHVTPERREVTYDRAMKFAESLGLPYIEVSAEEGTNVTEVFEKLADLIIEHHEKVQAPVVVETNRVTLKSQKSKQKHAWCSC